MNLRRMGVVSRILRTQIGSEQHSCLPEQCSSVRSTDDGRRADSRPAAGALRGEAHARSGMTKRPWRMLIDSVRDYAIFMLDPQGKILTWNPSSCSTRAGASLTLERGAERIKGYTAEEIIGQHFSASTRRRTCAPASASASWRWRCSEGRFEDEGWRVRKDGTRFWANVVITALRDSDRAAHRLRQGDARSDRAPASRSRSGCSWPRRRRPSACGTSSSPSPRTSSRRR